MDFSNLTKLEMEEILYCMEDSDRYVHEGLKNLIIKQLEEHLQKYYPDDITVK